MIERRATLCGRLLAAIAVATALSVMPSAMIAQDSSGKKEVEPPKTVELQVFVIMAAKGEKAQEDPSLKELAELLRSKFGKRFNQFALQRTTSMKIKHKQEQSCGLAADYFLKAKYDDAEMSESESPKIELALNVVRIVAGDSGSKEVGVLGPVGAKVRKNKFFLLGGPQVDDKTMILAVRVTSAK
ncbi:MAG: hypothetical protein JXL80_10905 [Planctomycetes bacterium]|nr:hypothetical protein [Planctomycetota bacterium]